MSSKIDYKEVNKLIKFMEEKNLSHFELEVEGFKIKINRNPSLSPAKKTSRISTEDSEPEAKEEIEPFESELQDGKNNIHYITSPMVGTFFRASDPSSNPFVEAGDSVKKNQTLCIIEAMKLMNEIESDVDGILKEVLVKNGKPVEYGQRLFAIQPLN